MFGITQRIDIRLIKIPYYNKKDDKSVVFNDY